MSHDIEASYAAAEVVSKLIGAPQSCFANVPVAGSLSGYAAREGRNSWPHADGVIELVVASGSAQKEFSIALEFKRPNEGVHGVLTAIGQSHAYLRKGYAGAVIVIPGEYSGLTDAGVYVKDVIDLTSKSEAIGVFTYTHPDMSSVSPFAGRLTLQRALRIDATPPIDAPLPLARTETQWAHVREGSSDPDAFFRYLQAVKVLGGNSAQGVTPAIPIELRDAVERLRPGADPERFLSNCPNNELADRAWRHFWFTYVLHEKALRGWSKEGGVYAVNSTASLVQRSDGEGAKFFFVGRTDSVKDRMVAALNSGEISEPDAFDALAQNYFRRAHSYREDVDSGCEHLGFVDSDGRLTDQGYKFVDACERFGNPNDGVPRAIFLRALLGEGGLGAFLHYVYRLSEELFRGDPMAFTEPPAAPGRPPVFKSDEYLAWVEDQMDGRLHVIRKVAPRGGAPRRPFQAELAVLRSLGIVNAGFRLGVGVVVNWPEFQDAMTLQEAMVLIH